MINVHVEGLDKLKEIFRGTGEKLERAFRRAMDKSIALVHRGAVQNIDKMTRTHSGFLKTRWEIKMSSFKSELYPLMYYAPYVHEGTRPYIIVPILKKALFWKGARHPVKKVHHPGIIPRPFLLRAIESSISKIKQFFKEEIENLFK